MVSTITIKNCNCIKEGEISIVNNSLNIKYGLNGTGKTTIGTALASISNPEINLDSLCPYGIDDNDEANRPSVSTTNFTNVMVFNDGYINTYLFVNNTFYRDSFKVLLKNPECDKISKDISERLRSLQVTMLSSDEIKRFRDFIPLYLSAVKSTDGTVSRRGGIGEMMDGYGSGFENHPELAAYKNYYSGRKVTEVSSWAKWRNDGIKQMHGEECPFCMSDFEKESMDNQNAVIQKVFKKSALDMVNAVVEYLDKALEQGYVHENAVKELKDNIGVEGKQDDIHAMLQALATETNYLIVKLDRISAFKPMNVSSDELKNIETCLNEMEISKSNVNRFYNTPSVNGFIDGINEQIEELKNKTGELKGLFAQHESKMQGIIESRKEDINSFFSIAGFPYQFVIKENGENKADTFLVPIENTDKRVDEPDKHLSWGERNAFSLVMFMFEAISEDADLIILDDPIASFDKNKKFAIGRRLFDNKRPSFRGKTVLMLTHDFQPVVDYIYGGMFTSYGIQTAVNATLIENVKGVLKERSIDKSDIVNVIELTKGLVENESEEMFVRIVNLRRYIEMTIPGYSELAEYDVISNLIHGREIPKDKEGNALSDAIVENGTNKITGYLKLEDTGYKDLNELISTEKLLTAIDDVGTGKYERIIAIRLLFERNDLLVPLRRAYPGACKFINETNHVENDYIFQLNPHVYFEIPDLYVEELQKFIEVNRDLITKST